MTAASAKWGPASRGSPGSAGVTQIQVVPTSASVASFRQPGTVRSVSFEFQPVPAGPAAVPQPSPGDATQGVPAVTGAGLVPVTGAPLAAFADPLVSLLALSALTWPFGALAVSPFLDPTVALLTLGAGLTPGLLGFDPGLFAGPLLMGLGLSLFV